MITISRKLFCVIIVGLATVAVASVCSLLHLSIDKAILVFIGAWIGLVAVFDLWDPFRR